MESVNDPVLQEDLEILARADLPWDGIDDSTVLVTGATGLVGSQIVKAILCRNRLFGKKTRVVAWVRNPDKVGKVFRDVRDRDEFEFYVGDIVQPISVARDVDFIVHTASATASKEFVEHPVEVIGTAIGGSLNILEFARQKHSRGVVYLSSMEAFGIVPPSMGKAGEKDLGKIDLGSPRSCYPESKRMVECLCAAFAAEYGLPVKTARLSQTFGAGIAYDENRVFAQFAKAAIECKDIVLHTQGLSWGNYCYTRDSVAAILTLLVKGNRGEAYTVANENSNLRIRDMAELVAQKVAKGKIQVVYDIPESSLTYGYAPDTELHLSSQKMQALGWRATVDLEESYERLIRSMLCNRRT